MIFTHFFNAIRFLLKSSSARCKSDVFRQDKKYNKMPFKVVFGDLEWEILKVMEYCN